MRDCTSSRRLTSEVAILAGRLAEMLACTGHADGESFLKSLYYSVHGGTPVSQWEDDPLGRFEEGEEHPLGRLARLFGWDALDVDLVLLAGMAEEHEGLAAVFRALHPRGDSRASAGL